MSSKYHDRENNITKPISKSLKENIDTINYLFKDSGDVVNRAFVIGGEHKVEVFVIYMDNMNDADLINDCIIRNLQLNMDLLPEKGKFEYIKSKGIRSADIKVSTSLNDSINYLLNGETLVIIDGYEKIISISFKKFPGRGVPESNNEVAVRGSKESFTESLATNRVLLRKRIKDTNFKLKSTTIGTRSKTNVSIAYIEDIAKTELIEEIEKRLNEYIVDGILDSGMLEQMLERNIYSPFPEFQATERPDKVASAILEGRVALIVDNSPMVIIAPATFSSYFQASDDYYEKWGITSFTRILRYIGAFLTMVLPGLYITVINYQPEILTSSMALTFAAAREGVPFSVLFEVLLMEIAFQLILEAGIRLPGPMGSTLGIVGGLIIGDAAVSANIVSPIVVIIVALTAITAFTVPNASFASAFRLIRYLVAIISGILGLYGLIVSVMFVIIHLAGLKSFGIPYMMPFDASGINKGSDTRDFIIRLPFKFLKRRPVYARKDERVRIVKRENEKKDDN